MRKPIIFAALLYSGLCSGLCSTPAYAAYRFRYQVTVDHTQAGSSDSANFPILVYISSNADFKTAANGGYIQHTTTLNGQTVPADLIVTTDTACQNPVTAWEVASYSASSGTVELWVNQGTLSHTSNTVFYICAGNPAVTTYQSTATNTWNSNFVLVQHLPNGTTLTANDSTANANNCTPTNTPTAASGAIDGAAAFASASSQYESCGTGSSIGQLSRSAATYSFWINPASSSVQMVLAKNDNNTVSAGWWAQLLLSSGSLFLGFVVETSGNNMYAYESSVALSTSAWTKIDIVGDGSVTAANQKFYVNGALATTATVVNGSGTQGNDSTQTLYMGFPRPNTNAHWGSCGYLNGDLDEIRLSNTGRSADWVTAEYNMEKPSQTMVTLGTRVALGGPRGAQVAELIGGLPTRGIR